MRPRVVKEEPSASIFKVICSSRSKVPPNRWYISAARVREARRRRQRSVWYEFTFKHFILRAHKSDRPRCRQWSAQTAGVRSPTAICITRVDSVRIATSGQKAQFTPCDTNQYILVDIQAFLFLSNHFRTKKRRRSFVICTVDWYCQFGQLEEFTAGCTLRSALRIECTVLLISASYGAAVRR
jgi:hypothetical protein